MYGWFNTGFIFITINYTLDIIRNIHKTYHFRNKQIILYRNLSILKGILTKLEVTLYFRVACPINNGNLIKLCRIKKVYYIIIIFFLSDNLHLYALGRIRRKLSKLNTFLARNQHFFSGFWLDKGSEDTVINLRLK